MSVGNDHFINEQQTFVPDTHRDAGISGKFRRIFGWQSSNRYTHTQPFPPYLLLIAAATFQLSQLLHQCGSATHQPSPGRSKNQTQGRKRLKKVVSGGGGLSRGTGETRWVRFRGMFRRFAFAGARLFATGSSTREIGLFHKRFASSLLFPSTYYSKRAPCFFF